MCAEWEMHYRGVKLRVPRPDRAFRDLSPEKRIPELETPVEHGQGEDGRVDWAMERALGQSRVKTEHGVMEMDGQGLRISVAELWRVTLSLT